MHNIRILHPSAKEWIKRGFKDFAGVYVGMAMCTVSLLGFMYDFRDGVQVVRYKSAYTIFRSDDPMARIYPRDYITDNHLLPPDHPKKIDECDEIPKGSPVSENSLYRKLSYMIK